MSVHLTCRIRKTNLSIQQRYFQILYTFCFAPKTWDLTPQYAEQIYQRTNGLVSKSTHSAKSRKYDTI